MAFISPIAGVTSEGLGRSMIDRSESESRKLLVRLRDTMAEEAAGQERLDKITHLTADSMGTEVCSIYLFRD